MTGHHYVKPHTRRNGTYVRGHYQRNPSRPGGGAGGGVVISILLIVVLLGAAASPEHGHQTQQQLHGRAAAHVIRPIHDQVTRKTGASGMR